MMKNIVLKNKYYQYVMLITEDGKLRHGMFVPTEGRDIALPVSESNAFPFEIMVNLNFEEKTLPHGNRYGYTLAAQRAVFVGMSEDTITGGIDYVMTLRDPVTLAEFHLHYEIYDESPALRRYTVIENKGEKELVINHISSFVLANFPYETETVNTMFLHRFTSGWCYEGEHIRESFGQLRIYRGGLTGFVASTTSGWVCQDHIPCFVIEQENSNLFTAIQIEHSSAWRFEIGNETHVDWDRFYLQGGIGNDVSAGWNLELAPGASFTTPAASMTVSYGDLDDVLNLMHVHQAKVLIHRNKADRTMPVIFNDWLCLEGDVSEEKILSQLDGLAELGVEYYVTDAGWFTEAEGVNRDWNTMVGCWKYNQDRFPHGMRYLVKEIRKRGMKAGIWCEIEAVGRNAPVYNDPDMLLMRENAFIASNGRRFLNFTSQATRDYADSVIGMIAEWGFEYIKIDYNADPAPGVSNAGSRYPGHGLHANRKAYDEWLDNIRCKYPQITIENCSSGGMRLEYNSLSRAELASVTDQGEFHQISRIAYNVTRPIHPSQCGIWTPASNLQNQTENYVFALTSSMMGRMHLSGNLCQIDDEKKQIIRNAVSLYKAYRDIIPECHVYHHGGDVFYYEDEKPYALELRSEQNDCAVVMLKNYDLSQVVGEPVILRGLAKGKYRIRSFPSDRKDEYIEVTRGELCLQDVYAIKRSAEILYIDKQS